MRNNRTIKILLVLVVAATAAVAGSLISGTERSDMQKVSQPDSAQTIEGVNNLPLPTAPSEALFSNGASADAAPTAHGNDTDRVIRKAQVGLRVENPRMAASAIVAQAKAAHGRVGTRYEFNGGHEITLSLRLPPDRLDGFIEDLRRRGTLLELNIESTDVEQQHVDLSARLANATASRDRLRSIYADAASVGEVVAIEDALTQRESEVEQLTAQLNYLDDQIAYSELNVSLSARDGEDLLDDDVEQRNPFRRGLDNGWNAVKKVARAVAEAAGFLLPFVPMALIVGVGAIARRRWALRRAGRSAHGQID